MGIMNKKYAYIDDATNVIASINKKIIFSLLIENLTKSHKNNKKRNMLNKISSNIACIIECIQDMIEDYINIISR